MSGAVATLVVGVLLLFSLQLLDTCQAQQSTDSTSSSTSTSTEIILNQDFQLLWYHWLAIIIVFAVVLIVLAPASVCFVYHLRK